MLNKNYKLGSRWKLFLLVPLTLIAFFFVACTEKDSSADMKVEVVDDTKIYYEAEEMPSFNDGEAAKEFRIYIAQNLIYPEQAASQGASGRIVVSFVVRKDGTVEIPDPEEVAKIQGKSLDEVVVVSYMKIKDETPDADEASIEFLKKEAVRVVTSSPKWKPGKINGVPVDVMYTFPINFVLQ